MTTINIETHDCALCGGYILPCTETATGIHVPYVDGDNTLWPGTRVLWRGSASWSKQDPTPRRVINRASGEGHAYYLTGDGPDRWQPSTITADRSQLTVLPPYANA